MIKGKSFLNRLDGKQTVIILLIIAIGVAWGGYATANDSQCIDCHTSARKLIKITREIAKTRPVIETKSKGLG